VEMDILSQKEELGTKEKNLEKTYNSKKGTITRTNHKTIRGGKETYSYKERDTERKRGRVSERGIWNSPTLSCSVHEGGSGENREPTKKPRKEGLHLPSQCYNLIAMGKTRSRKGEDRKSRSLKKSLDEILREGKKKSMPAWREKK